MKTCAKCKTQKPLDAFQIRRKSKDGRQGYCRDCVNVVHRQRRSAGTSARERATQDAWAAATTRIREAHRAEFDLFYAEERSRRDLPTTELDHRINGR